MTGDADFRIPSLHAITRSGPISRPCPPSSRSSTSPTPTSCTSSASSSFRGGIVRGPEPSGRRAAGASPSEECLREVAQAIMLPQMAALVPSGSPILAVLSWKATLLRGRMSTPRISTSQVSEDDDSM